MLNYTDIPEEYFQNILTQEDMYILKKTTQKESLNPAISAILGYSKTLVANNITPEVVRAFRNHGIYQFGQTVKDAQSKISEFLECNPTCKDADPRRCFNKILYKLCYEHYWRNQANNQQQLQQPAIGFAFG